MRRAIARGRILPQSLSTDPRYGRLSLKAQVLYPLLWVNCDDQGRLSGDPDEIKYAACPSIKQIIVEEIPRLLEQMETQGMIKLYTTSKTKAIQMLDWWEEQRLQWAWPSRYPPPAGWQDRLRYKPTPKEIVTDNWLPPSQLGSMPPNQPASPPPSQPASPPPNQPPSASQDSPLTTPVENEKEEEKEEGRGRGTTPGAPGSTSPSPIVSPVKLLNKLTECYRIGWGRVSAAEPDKVIPRRPEARIDAQMRDLAQELSSAGGCPLDYIDQAFREAAGQNKYSVSYVRAILLDWLGVARGPPG